MAKKKETIVEETIEQPKVDDKVEKIKVKKSSSMKKLSDIDEVTKVDLSKPKIEEDAVSERKTEKVDVEESSENSKEMGEETKAILEEVTVQQDESIQNEEKPVIEEITKEAEQLAEKVDEAVTEAETTGKELPENIQKLMQFMEDTGGDLEDYVKLNKDYSKMDNHALLKEYYKQTKPHLETEEIDFMMEDYFSYDKDEDEEVDIKRKKLALKEQVAQAKQHLDGAKSKYYEDIKYGSKLTGEQQEAVDFFNRYNKESKEQQGVAEKQHRTFLNKTNQLFNKDFKGFEYTVGEKKFRFNIKDSDTVKNTQSDINNFVKKFLNKNNEMEDAKGYHKSMFTAMNSDAIANHFYEQGKADALKASVEKAKNINMDPRQSHKEVKIGGTKYRVLSGDSPNDYKVRIKKGRK